MVGRRLLDDLYRNASSWTSSCRNLLSCCFVVYVVPLARAYDLSRCTLVRSGCWPPAIHRSRSLPTRLSAGLHSSSVHVFLSARVRRAHISGGDVTALHESTTKLNRFAEGARHDTNMQQQSTRMALDQIPPACAIQHTASVECDISSNIEYACFADVVRAPRQFSPSVRTAGARCSCPEDVTIRVRATRV